MQLIAITNNNSKMQGITNYIIIIKVINYNLTTILVAFFISSFLKHILQNRTLLQGFTLFPSCEDTLIYSPPSYLECSEIFKTTRI